MLAARNFAFLIVLVATVVFSYPATASIQTYDILEKFDTSGLSASWLYDATGTVNGSDENGSLLSGPKSSCISGSLEGDLSGNTLLDISGSVTGMVKQMSGYLNSVFQTSFSPSTAFELQLGKLSTGGDGALKFETDGASTGQFTGGFLDFSLYVDGAATSLIDGTFFFKPQAETGSDKLSPNRGTSSEFTLWGWNWMHDGLPVDGRDEPDWNEFLSGSMGLGYDGPDVSRTLPNGAPGVGFPLGIALYALNADATSSAPLHNPEPGTVLIWGVLSIAAVLASRTRCSRSSR
jgi:hypothetical protein